MHLPYSDKDYGVLERLLGGSDNFAAEHRVIKQDVFFNRRCPEWAKHDDQVRGLLLKVFPKLTTNPLQRKRAARWMRVIVLFYREGRSESHVSEVMNMPVMTVHRLIFRIRRRAAGLSSCEWYKRTGRPAGRPKKM